MSRTLVIHITIDIHKTFTKNNSIPLKKNINQKTLKYNTNSLPETFYV